MEDPPSSSLAAGGVKDTDTSSVQKEDEDVTLSAGKVHGDCAKELKFSSKIITMKVMPIGSDNKNQESSEEGQPISKRQMKRRARHEKWIALKPLRRQKEKDKLREKKRKLKEERERLGIDEDSIRGPKLIRMADPEASGVSVAIDCSFDHLMNDLEVRKVAKQIQRCYAANRRSSSPFQFHLCGFKSKTKSWFDEKVQGYSNWDVHFHKGPVEEVFPKDKVVYLSSESENILEALDPSKAYIIGGLVDHNHQKGLCHEIAKEKGWHHAQLPIGSFVEMNGRKVLTINQVFEILIAFSASHDWREAFYHVLPARKVKTFVQDSTIERDDSIKLGSENSKETERSNGQEVNEEATKEECTTNESPS